MRHLKWTAGVMVLGLAACGSPEPADEATPATDVAATPAADANMLATATLKNADGADVGMATARPSASGILISLNVTGMPAGEHGAHVHTVGKCDAPDFKSAEGHWNPTEQQHGLEDPAGQHAGDMPNLKVGEDGSGTLEYTLQGGTFDGLLDSDGSALVIHAGRDDQKTDPSGDSGDRIACGVFAAS